MSFKIVIFMICAVLVALAVTGCGTTKVVSEFCEIYDYQPYSEATKGFWRRTTDPDARADRLRTARHQKTYRCLCPEYHDLGTEGCQ